MYTHIIIYIYHVYDLWQYIDMYFVTAFTYVYIHTENNCRIWPMYLAHCARLEPEKPWKQLVLPRKKWHGMVEKPLHSWCKSMQTLCWQRSLQPLYFSYARTGKPWNFSCCSRTRMQPWKEPTKPNATVKRRREAGVYPFGREKTIWPHIWDFMVGSTWGFFLRSNCSLGTSLSEPTRN